MEFIKDGKILENLNEYYNFEKRGNELIITSKENTSNTIAFFKLDGNEKGGMISIDMLTGVEYKSLKRWFTGLEKRRSIFVNESNFVDANEIENTQKTVIEIITTNDFTDQKIITKKEIELVAGEQIQVDLIYTDETIIELNSNFVTVESLIKEFGEIFEVITTSGDVIRIKNNPKYANDWRSQNTRTIENYQGINRIAGEPINNYYYGLKAQNIKVNDIICVTTGMITSKVLEVKKTAKGVTFVLDNNRNRNFKNDSVVIVANNGLKQVDTNIINLVNDGCIALMMEEIILNNNIDKYRNMVKNYSDKIELYKKHLEILGLIEPKTKKEEVKTVQETTSEANDVAATEDINTLENKVNNFVKLVQNDHIKEMQRKKYNFYDIVSFDIRKKYILVDIGTSGRYMIDKETQIIYGVKGYGKVNKNKVYGTLDTINNYYWGNFYAFKLKEEREINFNNLLTVDSLQGKVFEPTKTVIVETEERIYDTEIIENESPEDHDKKNNLINGITPVEEDQGLKTVPEAPNNNIIFFNAKKPTENILNGSPENKNDSELFKYLFNESEGTSPEEDNKNNLIDSNVISFDNLKNKKSNDENLYTFDSPSSSKNHNKNKIKMCVCGAILKTEEEKNLNICSCCIDYANQLYINRQLPPDILKLADELLEEEKKKQYSKAINELKEELKK